MKTSRRYTFLGITIPEGYPCEETDSCAAVVRYDESKGCSFNTGSRYAKPSHGMPLAVPWSITDEAEFEKIVDESRYQ